MSTLNSISLFSNCGAGDLGFARAGFCFRVMAELVNSRLDVALLNHSGAIGVPGDLRKTWPLVVQQWRLNEGANRPDLLAACPPCQGMSSVRSGRGLVSDPEAGSKDPRNLLVVPIARIASELAPSVVVVENVTAFLRRMVRDPDSGEPVSAARLLVRMLTDAYEVFPFLTDLADYGVPQTRKRAFLTFVRRESGAVDNLRTSGKSPYPRPTNREERGRERISLEAALKSYGLIRLDSMNDALASDGERKLHFVPVWPARQYRMVAAIPPNSGGSAWENRQCEACGDVEVSSEAVDCPDCKMPLLRPFVVEEGRRRLVKGFRRASYRRMDPSRPAATVTTASGRIGGSRTIHPYENRVLSPLECALLQTIPAEFDWGETLETRGVCELRAMIGEAVPPKFTEMHGKVLAGLLQEDFNMTWFIDSDNPRCEVAAERLRIGCREG